jgi:hypothetical protein
MSGHNKYLVKRVRVKAPPATTTSPDMVKYQRALRVTVAQSPHFNDDPAIKTNFDKWSTVTDQLDTNHGLISPVESQLVTLRGQEGLLRAQYLLDADLFLTTLRAVFVNNAQALSSMGIQPEVVPAVPHPLTWPSNLRVVPIKGQPGHHMVRWHSEHGAGLYDLQRSPDPPVEATFASVYSDKYVKFADSGTVGQIVWYRVRAHGNGVSAWSPAIAYTIR